MMMRVIVKLGLLCCIFCYAVGVQGSGGSTGPSPFVASAPLSSSPLPSEGAIPSSQSETPALAPPYIAASPQVDVGRSESSPPPIVSPRKAPARTPSIVSLAPAPTSTPLASVPQGLPLPTPTLPGASSPGNSHETPVVEPLAPESPSKAPPKENKNPVAAPPSHIIKSLPPANQSPIKDHDFSPGKAPPGENRNPIVAAPDYITKSLPPGTHSKARPTEKTMRRSGRAPTPSALPPTHEGYSSPVSSPSASFSGHYHGRSKTTNSPPTSPSPVIPPVKTPTKKHRHYAPPPLYPGSGVVSPSHSPTTGTIPDVSFSPASSPSPENATRHPKIAPSGSSSMSPKTSIMPLLPPFHALPPPPPNEDCSGTVCMEPYTNTPPGSPCGCVWPMQVGLRLTVALYIFFPLVSELAQEIASGVFMKQSQVRIVGANAASEQPEKTIVLIDLVPLEEKFDNTTAFLIYQRFWNKKVAINASYFGYYEVIYVRYPGLPPAPPVPPSDVNIIDDGPYTGNNNNARKNKPLGVDVPRSLAKNGLSGGVIAIIVLSALVAVISGSAVIWVLALKHREQNDQPASAPQNLIPSIAKSSGMPGSTLGSGPSSASLSFGSSMATYTGSAKTFTVSDIEKATDNFDDSKILGEGGFGRVYSGVLDDGSKVAVKVLKRDDQQGGREFLAEVEMLSRLHHRNLVKLIGICTEERVRCLVYELIPNGSLESHLHGVDKETSPLDWTTRMKIALGAARGLAYLHEDSSPRVIHRDFKSSNILLEHDFTPKVSDFGLAKTAMDEESSHISTRVMGTFGYVAPEYAMTGHLLVKSDVYSYGVVLLELLTGRKPVDMSQPPGQENLVAWARPLLTSKEDLQFILDPSLGPDVSLDSVAKVAAIASMCVQPEVSHRPFMGEVVQALKLVCAECDEARDVGSRNSSREDLSIDIEAGPSAGSMQLQGTFHSQFSEPNYDSGHDSERGLSVSDLFSTTGWYGRQVSGSFRRHLNSGPLTTGRGSQFWQRVRRSSGGSLSEHAILTRLWPGSH